MYYSQRENPGSLEEGCVGDIRAFVFPLHTTRTTGTLVAMSKAAGILYKPPLTTPRFAVQLGEYSIDIFEQNFCQLLSPSFLRTVGHLVFGIWYVEGGVAGRRRKKSAPCEAV